MVRGEVKALVGVALGFMSTSLTGCGEASGGEEVHKCKAMKFGNSPPSKFRGELSEAPVGGKIDVTCPDGYEYKGDELECGYYDKECPHGSDNHCNKLYGALKKGEGLKEFPDDLAPRVIQTKKDEKEEKSRRLKGKKEEDKKTTTLPPLLFDCLHGNANWQMGWSLEKADYCCREIPDHQCKVVLPKPVKPTGPVEDLCVKKAKEDDKKPEEKFEVIANVNVGSDGPGVSAFVLAAAMSFAIFGAVLAMARRARSSDAEGYAREQEMSLATDEVTAEE